MFKRVLSLCVALVLVAGASGDLFAAVEDFQIEVISPPDSATISIGDEISVNVYVIKGVVDSVVVGIGSLDASDPLGEPDALPSPIIGLLTGVSPSRAKGTSVVDTFKAKVIAVGDASLLTSASAYRKSTSKLSTL